MRLLTYSTVFWPSIGGIENCLRMLASEFVRQGVDVTVVTETPGNGRDAFPFPVVRGPSLRTFCSLLARSDLIHQNNVTLKRLHALALVPRPLVISHHTAYVRHSGRPGLRDLLKLGVARCTVNLACSRFIARQFPRCAVVLNPYDDTVFTNRRLERDRDLIFVGRLVSQKGCDTLIEALALLRTAGLLPSCTIVGDGPERPRLEAMATEHGLSRQIEFVGPKAPERIAELLNCHRIQVVPSRYREPFGIVALEGLACGCLPVVSVEGGLVEAIGRHGLTFRNGDPADLAHRLEGILRELRVATQLLEGVEHHLAQFTARRVAERYVTFFSGVLEPHLDAGRPN